jgi:hypothetical protein
MYTITCNCYIYRHGRAEEGDLEHGLFHYLILNPKPDTHTVIHINDSYRYGRAEEGDLEHGLSHCINLNPKPDTLHRNICK